MKKCIRPTKKKKKERKKRKNPGSQDHSLLGGAKGKVVGLSGEGPGLWT